VRTAILLLFCLALSGCYVKLHGHQSTSGGVTTTTTSSTVTGSAKASGAKVSFSSGTPVSPSAPGGHISLNRGASAVLVLGLVIADVVNYFNARLAAKPQQPAGDGASIAETCSCYKPVSGDQSPVTGDR
jgi:hypothetical protein